LLTVDIGHTSDAVEYVRRLQNRIRVAVGFAVAMIGAGACLLVSLKQSLLEASETTSSESSANE